MTRFLRYIILIKILFFIFSINVYSDDSIRLAVLDFQSNGASKFATKAVSEIISTELAKIPELTVIERSQIGSILREQGFQQTGCTEQECAVEMGKLLSVNKIVIGTVSKIGNTFVITVKVVNVETGKIDFADSEKCMSEDELEQSSKVISSKIVFTKFSTKTALSENTSKKNSGNRTDLYQKQTSSNDERYPFSIGTGVRFGYIYNVNIPIWNTNYKNPVITNGKTDLAIKTIVLSPSYEFTKYFTIKADLKYMIDNNLKRGLQDEISYFDNEEIYYRVRANKDFSGYGIALKPSLTYFKNKSCFFFSPGIGYDVYKIEPSILEMHYVNVYYSNQIIKEYSVSFSDTVYSPLLKIEAGILYNLSQNFDFFIAFGIDYHFYSELFSDIELKEDFVEIHGTPPSYTSNLVIDYNGNFPPEFYIECGMNFRLF